MDEKLSQYLSQFLKNNERVLICWPMDSDTGKLLSQCVASHGGIPVCWGNDMRWSALLRLAFTGRYRVIAGPPQLILGLSKLSKQRGTPLYVRNAILTEEGPQWVRDSIETGLDCKVWTLDRGDILPEPSVELLRLKKELLCWSSVLDCRLVKGTYGLEIQVVCFPGKKLPRFPTCAKLDIQPWDPERHIPFYLVYNPKHPGLPVIPNGTEDKHIFDINH